jgi:uncharacterized membrane protein
MGNSGRVLSVDIIRGIVMVLMAIDHVRVFSGLPAGGPTPGIFFTRWVTHFAAPAFVFLAGTAAFLHGRKLGDTRALSRYLITRGLLLILLEFTVIRLGWTFNFDFYNYNLAGVIWMLGWCMILMAALVHLRTKTIGIIGVAIIFLQQLIALPATTFSEQLRNSIGWIWSILYFGGELTIGPGGPNLVILYSIVPWIGVMAAGYAFGTVLIRDAGSRDRLCLRIGLAATMVFVVAAGALTLMNPGQPDDGPILFRFLGQQKYPASQLFLLMTLGPTIALLPFAERARGFIADALALFGRVPLFYYLLHIPLIHLLALIVSIVRDGRVTPWLFGNHPMRPPPLPDGYMWSLPLLYLVFVATVVILYFPCRWFARVKATRKESWLRYL